MADQKIMVRRKYYGTQKIMVGGKYYRQKKSYSWRKISWQTKKSLSEENIMVDKKIMIWKKILCQTKRLWLKEKYHGRQNTYINSSQMDLEKIVSAIFSNLSLNIDMGKKN
jgi:hypothetical protein